MISSELFPAKGTEARVSVSLSTNASLWPFLHTQTHTHAVFFGVKKENILTLKLMLQRRTGSHSGFFGCEGRKYPHTQSQTHSVFSPSKGHCYFRK